MVASYRPKRSDFVNFAPDIRVGRECLLNLHRIYIYFNQRFINHDNVLIPCTNNFDQTRPLHYYKCKWTYHVRKSTASKRTPHASHSNHPEYSVRRGGIDYGDLKYRFVNTTTKLIESMTVVTTCTMTTCTPVEDQIQ